MIKKFAFIGLIVLIVFFLLVGLSSFVKDSPKEIVTINYTFMVKEGMGINLDRDKLNFGGGPAGVVLKRTMNISSAYDSFVHIESVGPGQLIVDINDFDLNNSQSVELEFLLDIPSDLPLDFYEGTVFIYFYER